VPLASRQCSSIRACKSPFQSTVRREVHDGQSGERCTLQAVRHGEALATCQWHPAGEQRLDLIVIHSFLANQLRK
jgi:hypothetical protein